VAEQHDLLAGAQREGAEDGVAALGGVGDEGQPLGLRAEEGGEPRGGVAQGAPGSTSAMKRLGCASIRARQASCAASTTLGVAP
jgi:hypothetical protein